MPPGVVTVTSTGPVACAGVVTRSVVGETRTRLVAVAVPNLTADPRLSPVPVSVTTVPPARGPVRGDSAVIDGTGSYAYVADVLAGEVP